MPELVKKPRQPFIQRRGRKAQLQPLHFALARPLHRLGRAVQLPQDAPPIGQQKGAWSGQAHLLGVSLQKRYAQLVLKRLDVSRERRLGKV